jgi:hypothetical protein
VPLLAHFFLICLTTFFSWRFCAFLNKRSSKTPLKHFGKKHMSKTFYQENKWGGGGVLTFFPSVFIAFLGRFSARGAQEHQKKT